MQNRTTEKLNTNTTHISPTVHIPHTTTSITHIFIDVKRLCECLDVCI